MKASDLYSPAELQAMPTLHQGQCCDCKIDTGNMRVWVCRVGNGVTIERLHDGRWETVVGDCIERLEESNG